MSTETKHDDMIVSFRLLLDERVEVRWASGTISKIPIWKLQSLILENIELPGISRLESNVNYVRQSLGRNVFVRMD